MFTILDQCQEALTQVQACGSLSRADYGQFIAQLEESIRDRHSDSCWIELSGFQGVQPGALVDKLDFEVYHCRAIRRCAIVGDRAWSQCLPRVARAIFPEAEVRYFDVADHDRARRWLDESREAATTAC
jgi:hypothetical protein